MVGPPGTIILGVQESRKDDQPARPALHGISTAGRPDRC
jgi:hypothetical protein